MPRWRDFVAGSSSLMIFLVFTLGVAAAALFGMSGRANADTILARVGVWEAYRTRSHLGEDMCGISQISGDYRIFIKYFSPADSMVFEIGKRGWDIPEGISVRMNIVVDNRIIWRGSFVRSGVQNNSIFHQIRDADELFNLIGNFAEGRLMRIVFLEGSEGAWVVPLVGTRRVTAAFLACVENLARRPSQPFGPRTDAPPVGRPVPTQPFGRPAMPDAVPADDLVVR